MDGILALAQQNLLSPIILSFVLGLAAALVRSDLNIPEAIAKGLSVYLLFAIGFKGGANVSSYGADLELALALLAGIILSASLPFVAYGMLRLLTRLSVVDAAAVAAHYGSISIVTFVAASTILDSQGIGYEGYMVAVAAAMEAPAILTALWLISRAQPDSRRQDSHLWREVMLNGSIILLVGAFVIGWITGEDGKRQIDPFITAPFHGILCLFLLDMGLVAGRGLHKAQRVVSAGALVFGITMPLVGSLFGLLAGLALGLSLGGVTLLMVLAASASYIAVPAAMRVALPEANPAVYLTLSLCITFPFNLILGIPLYITAAELVMAG